MPSACRSLSRLSRPPLGGGRGSGPASEGCCVQACADLSACWLSALPFAFCLDRLLGAGGAVVQLPKDAASKPALICLLAGCRRSFRVCLDRLLGAGGAVVQLPKDAASKPALICLLAGCRRSLSRLSRPPLGGGRGSGPASEGCCVQACADLSACWLSALPFASVSTASWGRAGQWSSFRRMLRPICCCWLICLLDRLWGRAGRQLPKDASKPVICLDRPRVGGGGRGSGPASEGCCVQACADLSACWLSALPFAFVSTASWGRAGQWSSFRRMLRPSLR